MIAITRRPFLPHEQASFDDSQALTLAPAHTIAWGMAGQPVVQLGVSGASLTVNGDPLALASAISTETARASAAEARLAALASTGNNGQMSLNGIAAGLNLQLAGAESGQSGSTVAVVNDGTDTYPANAYERFLDPVAAISAFTETLPAAPPDGLIVHFSCGQAIYNLRVVANINQRLRPATTGTGQAVITSCSAIQGDSFVGMRLRRRGPKIIEVVTIPSASGASGCR